METKVFPAKAIELGNVLEFVHKLLDQTDAGIKDQMQIDVAVEELFINIAHYAYDDGSEGTCEVNAGVDEDGMFTVRFKDMGCPFDPLEKEDPDVELPAENRQIGGLGIFIVKKFMDKVLYERDGDYNVMTIGKKL